jgi:hypothetical protein
MEPIKTPTEVRSGYVDDQNFTHIDVWFTEDDNEEGFTAAIVCNDTAKVYFCDNRLRNDPKILEEISNVLQSIPQTMIVVLDQETN